MLEEQVEERIMALEAKVSIILQTQESTVGCLKELVDRIEILTDALDIEEIE